ncbi:hypothetical protein SAMN05192574_105427 [Mucilaginibacter gossypiicola]|uniref:Uncharacterized protein n=1 Tax=Mucilaginibacter gossypiicola TaxID=551995 RepID=A0A1H8M7K1_9SPHI|nr:hypothetical protein [Mucilaginibacter gossypiicola]SEO13305.1 hypothetical protein SAMN05192574_105427 [Mucilaginibacter gossypiicola]
MRTSLNEIKEIDDHVLKLAPPDEALLFEAKLIINPELKQQVVWHKQTLGLVQQYGRNNFRAEIEAVHQKLFNLPEHEGFRQKIMRLFRKR